MSNFSNELTDAQLERLVILAEECAEIQQIISKIIRHGYESYHPLDPSTTNRALLAKEIGHTANAVNMLVEVDDVQQGAIFDAQDEKEETIKQYLHHQD